MLKCVKSLTVGLKALNPISTLATFDYEILNSCVTEGTTELLTMPEQERVPVRPHKTDTAEMKG